MPKNFSSELSKNLIPQNNNSQESKIKSEADDKVNKVWNQFLELLSDRLTQSEINTWFSVISPKSFENNILTIKVPS